MEGIVSIESLNAASSPVAQNAEACQIHGCCLSTVGTDIMLLGLLLGLPSLFEDAGNSKEASEEEEDSEDEYDGKEAG